LEYKLSTSARYLNVPYFDTDKHTYIYIYRTPYTKQIFNLRMSRVQAEKVDMDK